MVDNIGGKDGSEATFGGRLPWQDRYDRQILGPGRSNGESGKGHEPTQAARPVRVDYCFGSGPWIAGQVSKHLDMR